VERGQFSPDKGGEDRGEARARKEISMVNEHDEIKTIEQKNQ
jgi:hypothetical protein